MRQETFERARAERWARFEALLAGLESRRAAEPAEFPSLYRALCQDLALARERGFSRSLLERLNRMALQGHEQLYAARGRDVGAAMRELLRSIPRAVRAYRGSLLFVSALFFGLAGAVGWLCYRESDFIYGLMDVADVREYEAMYGPGRERGGQAVRSRVLMFGFYIMNNISITFRAFASGLLLGVGSLFFVAFNGAHFGALLGHLIRVGSGDALGRFVVAHGAFEIPALLVAAAGGTALGSAWLEPGSRTRLAAVRERARSVLPLAVAAGLMDVIAAGIEAFWSPLPLGAAVQYGVGAALWAIVVGGLLAMASARAA